MVLRFITRLIALLERRKNINLRDTHLDAYTLLTQSSSCSAVLGGKVSLTAVFCCSVSDFGNATE